MKTSQGKPSIVFCYGLWADGSCFSNRAMAKRMGATTYEIDSSHVPMLSQPERVLDVIRTAANSFEGAAKRATA